MNNLLKIFVLIIIVFVNTLYSKTIKITFENDSEPFSYVDKNKISKGFLLDYWTLWGEKVNVNIEFLPGTGSQTLNNIKNNDADIHAGLLYIKNRENYLDYAAVIYESSLGMYINRKNINTIKNINDLNGKTVAVVKGSYSEIYLRKNYPRIRLKIYLSYILMSDVISKNEVDGVFSESLSMWHELIKSSKFTHIIRLKGFKPKTKIYASVNKGNDSLQKLILEGIGKISKEEIISLENKWIIDEKFRMHNKKIKKDILSVKERLYLKNNKNLKLAMHKGWKLMSFYNEDKVFSGFHVDILKQINKNLNTNIVYKVFDNWTEAYDSSKNDEIDGIFGLSWKKEREEIFSYSPKYFFSPYYTVGRKNDNSLKDIKNLNNKIAVAQKNSIAIKILQKNSPNIKIVYAKNQIDALDKINKNIADLTIKDDAYEYDLKKYNLNIKNTFFTKEGELHIGTSKKDKIFTSIINKGIKSISIEQMDKIKNKWKNNKVIKSVFTKEELRYINESDVLNVGISDWKPLFYTSNGENIEGLAGDILTIIFKYSGLKINLVEKVWHELLEDFKDNKIDILPTTYYTKNRSEFGLYTDSYLSIKDFIYVSEENNDIFSLGDLAGKRLAIPKGHANIDFIKNSFPSIKLIMTLSLDESIFKVMNNEVDALIESQFAVEYKLNTTLISGLKAISQNDIKRNDIHMFIQNNNLILKSILEKSLYSIPIKEKNKIISKWLKIENKKSVNIALKVGREPYTFNKTYLKGIEYDLVKLILEKSDISINNVKNLSLSEQNIAFEKDNDLDMIVSIKEKDDKYFYSDQFISFDNVVISRYEDKIQVDNISDLKNKNIIAFEGASLYLPKEYKDIFSLKPKNYKEEILQEKQVKDFLDKKTDIIILGKNIFKWFLKKLSNKNLNEFKFDYIFPSNNQFKVAFRDERLKNLFNENYQNIKESGEYQEIIDSYLESDILAKVKINTLISSLLSKYIYEKDIKEINNIIKIFENLDYINKIEVYTDKLISISSNKQYNNPIKQDSYFYILNIPHKVGYIKVFFNEKNLKKASSNLDLIPNISIFLKLKSYGYIKTKYKDFNYLDKEIIFSEKEKKFIKNNPILKYSKIKWEPLAIIKNGNFSGILDEYIKMLEKYSDIKFKFVESGSLVDIKNKLKNKSLDLLPLPSYKEMKEYSVSSEKFVNFDYVLVMKKNNIFVDNINDLKNKTFVMPKSFTSYRMIKDFYPNIKIINSKDNKEALEQVSLGKADVTLIHEAVAVYYMQKFFPDLKVVGISKYKFNHSFSIHKDNPELLSIINKIISHISQKEHQDIKNKWTNYKVSTAVDYRVIYQIVFAFVLILLIVLYFLKRISDNKNKILKINNKLEDTIDTLEKTKYDLQEQKDLFEALFKGTSDGLALIEDYKVINTNYSLLKMYDIEDKIFFKTYKLGSLSPTIQPDGQNSMEVYNKYFNLCELNNHASFESLVHKTTGEQFWVNIIMVKIKTNNRNLIYSITRDISNRKILEEEIQNKAKDLENSNNELEDSNEELQSTIHNLKQTQNQLIASEKMASLGGLVAGVAHEINTPVGIGLTGISHLEELTQIINKQYENEEMSQEEFEEYLKNSKELSFLIHKNLEKAASLVRSFKQVAVDQSSEAKREFNFKEYLNEILQSIHSVTKKTNIEIKIFCPENIKINSFAGAYSQIITNLIMNSLIHGFKEKENGNITINVEQKGNELKIIYKDSGRGIKKENLNKIFDPFFTTNRDNGGSGLGLNIIYNIIISKLNGKIKCISQENNGVEFVIILNIDNKM